MRQRIVNEHAVKKTLAFLNGVYEISNSGIQFTLSAMHEKFGVSKSTGSCLIKLSIIEHTNDNFYKWIGDTVTREMALQVLEILRRRNDKMVAVPLTGFESLVDSLAIIADGMKRQPKSLSETKDNNLFTPADKKQDDLIKIVSAIAGGVYVNAYMNGRPQNEINDYIVDAAHDLLTKIYK